MYETIGLSIVYIVIEGGRELKAILQSQEKYVKTTKLTTYDYCLNANFEARYKTHMYTGFYLYTFMFALQVCSKYCSVASMEHSNIPLGSRLPPDQIGRFKYKNFGLFAVFPNGNKNVS